MVRRISRAFALAALLSLGAQAQPAACNARTAAPSVTVALPARPFAVAPSRDGCWVFVSMLGDERGNNPGIAVLKRSNGRIELARVAIPVDFERTGSQIIFYQPTSSNQPGAARVELPRTSEGALCGVNLQASRPTKLLPLPSRLRLNSPREPDLASSELAAPPG